MVDRGCGQNFKSGVGQTKILPLPLPSSRSVTSPHTISLSEFQLPPLPNRSETPYLLRDGVRQGDNTIIIVCSRQEALQGPAAWESFREEPQLARPEELASWEGVGPRVGSLLLLRPASILGADSLPPPTPCNVACDQRTGGGLNAGSIL